MIDTGCGKTTVIQFLSFVLNQKLFTVNCHATTETSDLIGGLRPVRGRDSIKKQIFEKLRKIILSCPDDDMLKGLEVNPYISEEFHNIQQSDDSSSVMSELYDVDNMVELARNISRRSNEMSEAELNEGHTKKRRKFSESSSPGNENGSASARACRK